MKTICITNRLLCKKNFFEQIKLICEENIYAVILREKDLDDETYEKVAIKCSDICKKNNVLFFINTKINIAQKLNIKNIQLSFKDFLDNKKFLNLFDTIAVSVHSLKEAVDVERCMDIKTNVFLIAGHIFETDCKKGLKPKGTKFLREICDNVKLPVFAIGGINEKNIGQLTGINVEGICLMSSLMKKSPKSIFRFK